jgi:hypothetical protein
LGLEANDSILFSWSFISGNEDEKGLFIVVYIDNKNKERIRTVFTFKGQIKAVFIRNRILPKAGFLLINEKIDLK